MSAPLTSLVASVTLRGASVIGREHLRLGRNNQDGWFAGSRGALSVAVVTDGCSSQPQSEVGAQLGARFLGETLLGADVLPESGVASFATSALVRWLESTAAALAPGRAPEVAAVYFFFTFLCAVKRNETALVFGVGDGLLSVDGVRTELDPGPDNAPAYAAYRLFGNSVEPVIHFAGRASRVAVATDGLNQLSEAQWAALVAPSDSKNPLQLQRALNVAAERERLFDDSTVVVIDEPAVGASGLFTAVNNESRGGS